MKNKLIYTIFFLYTFIFGIAQNPMEIQYQLIVRAEDNTAIQSQEVTLGVEVLQESVSGEVVFSESHTLTTSSNGTAIFTIGSLENGIGTISDIIWGDNDYFLKVNMASRTLGIEKIMAVPFVKMVPTALTVNRFNYSDLDNLPESYFDGDYNSLTGDIPSRYITEEESNKIDSIELTKAFDFQSIEDDNVEANSMVSTPKFGTESGTIYEGDKAWKVVEGNLIHDGSVGINVPIPSDFGGAGIKVKGAILYDGVPVTPSPGMLFYDPSVGSGSFCFYDENGDVVTLGTGELLGGGTRNSGYKVYTYGNPPQLDGFIDDKSLVVGNGASIEKNAGDYTMVLVSNVIRIKYDDTSSSSSFPRNDWQIATNDVEEGGDNYFAIVDASANKKPFRISASADDDALFVADNGNVGVNTQLPTEKVEVNGNVKGKSFVGNASKLTGITYSGTGLVENTGSTTIAADDDSNGTGQIEFAVNDTNRLIISNNGNVGIDTIRTVMLAGKTVTPKLDVNGTAAFEDLIVNGNIQTQSACFPIHKETINTSGILQYDVEDKSVVVLNPIAGNINLFLSFSVITEGQEIVIINESPTNSISLYNSPYNPRILFPGNLNVPIGQYESVRLVYNRGYWIVTDLIKAS